MDKKWNLQDIRTTDDRPRRSAPRRKRVVEEERVAPVEQEPQARPRKRDRGSRNRKPLVVSLVILAVILIPGIVIGYLLDGAKLTVYPRHREPNVNTTVTAYAEPRPGELTFDVMTLEAEGERQVTATGEAEVEEQATGEIEISNTRDSSERLIKNTRFETPDGLIFRINESVVVPAATDNGPGTVRTKVFADEPGEQYNIAPTTFTVPGYEEGGYDELFAAITAKSTAAMQGGFAGVTYVVDDAELASAKDSLHRELEDALRKRIESERPAGFTLFESGATFTYESAPSTPADNNMVTIKEKVLLHVPVFENGHFASFIAGATIPGYEDESVRIEDPSELTFAYVATTTPTDLRSIESFEASLKGQPLVVWTFDSAKLKEDLAGSAKTALPTILGGYPAIERAEAVIRPFWKRSFPDSPEGITIIESIGEADE